MRPMAHTTDLRASFGGGHGVEAHQHVRQTGGAQHQRDRQ